MPSVIPKCGSLWFLCAWSWSHLYIVLLQTIGINRDIYISNLDKILIPFRPPARDLCLWACNDPCLSLCLQHASVLDYFEREVKYLKYCEQEFKEYQKFKAKTELKWSWRQRERKQYVILGIKKTFYVSLYL